MKECLVLLDCDDYNIINTDSAHEEKGLLMVQTQKDLLRKEE